MAFFVMLQTKRLVIREAQPSDAESLFEVYGDPHTMKYWDSLPDADATVTARRVERIMQQTDPVTYFVFQLDGTPVGTGGVHEGTEIGFILHRAQWRKGLMTEALEVLIPHLFGVLDTDHLTADVDPLNTASLTFLDKLGFVQTGHAERTVKLGDRWCDSTYLRLDRRDQ